MNAVLYIFIQNGNITIKKTQINVRSFTCSGPYLKASSEINMIIYNCMFTVVSICGVHHSNHVSFAYVFYVYTGRRPIYVKYPFT